MISIYTFSIMPEKHGKHKSKNKDVTIRPKEDQLEASDLDKLLWESYVQDVAPLKQKGYDHGSPEMRSSLPKPIDAPRKRQIYSSLIPSIALREAAPYPEYSHKQEPLDRGMDQKFRKGLLPIDGRLDLHGYTVEVAFRIFLEFMERHNAGNSRCLLIITGKGLDRATGIESGAIRSEFPKWLGLPRFSGLVLSHCNAPTHMGGSGAFLVLLRKRKPTSKG